MWYYVYHIEESWIPQSIGPRHFVPSGDTRYLAHHNQVSYCTTEAPHRRIRICKCDSIHIDTILYILTAICTWSCTITSVCTYIYIYMYIHIHIYIYIIYISPIHCGISMAFPVAFSGFRRLSRRRARSGWSRGCARRGRPSIRCWRARFGEEMP